MGGSEEAQDGQTRMLMLEALLDRILWVASDRKLIHMRLKQTMKFCGTAENDTCLGNPELEKDLASKTHISLLLSLLHLTFTQSSDASSPSPPSSTVSQENSFSTSS